MARTRIPTAADLGLMEGTPPTGDALVTRENWEEPPHNRWGFLHVRDLVPTARISRGEGRSRPLPRAERDLARASIRVAGRSMRLDRFCDETYTDGLLVLHRGRVIHERYANELTPSTTHLLMSVSKSITSTVTGILVGRGLLSPDDLVTRHIPELVGTSFDGCRVRHLLDMRAGTRFNEDYDDPKADVRVYEEIYQWQPRRHRGLPASITEYYGTLKNQGPHGGPFDYRSILTDLLGWVIERASGMRFPDLVSRELWIPMGAEHDADVTVDAHGNAMADGGICCTLRDLARFGQLMLDGGRRGRTQVVPRTWIRDTLEPDDDTVAAFQATADARELPAGAYYRNKWWVVDPTGPIYMGSGINGQTVLIHGPARVVIAKFSTWPVAWEEGYAIRTRTGLVDLAERVADGRL